MRTVLWAALFASPFAGHHQHHHGRQHHRGCNTRRCDRHIDHVWARRHRRAGPSSWTSDWTIPTAIVMCESGGANLPPNEAGASGYYQIIPGTWSAYGGSRYAPEAYEADREQQGAVAARIWDGGAGAEQWVCKA